MTTRRQCSEISTQPIAGWVEHRGWWECANAGHGVTLETPAGRPSAHGGPYCDEHGGAARARSEAERDWNYAAPASVGDAAAVEQSGHLHLDTTHAYVVLRQDPNGPWLAWLGLGSLLVPVRHDRPSERQRGGRRHRRRIGQQGRCAFGTREEAKAAARAVWSERVADYVTGIRIARGGTLAWGVPVEPLAEPHVIVLEPDGNAWRVAVVLPRQSRPGFAMLSGLRPSGEAV